MHGNTIGDDDLDELVLRKGEEILMNADSDVQFQKQYEHLDSIENKQEYTEQVNTLINDIKRGADVAAENEKWFQTNYAQMRSDYEEARETVKNNIGIDLDFESAVRYSDDTIDNNERLKEIHEAFVKADENGKITPETRKALQAMLDITNDLEVHSTVGTDKFLQNVGMSKYNDKDETEYRASGTGGKTDDLEGIGESNIGTGIGGGIAGNGKGTGLGDGSGSDSNSSSTSFNSNKGEVPLGNVAYNGVTDDGDAQAIASYLEAIGNEVPVNHIFHNDFYNSQPVSHWAFSVDFIPAAYLRTMTQEDMFEMSRTLTKAILSVEVPERVLQTTVSHYKGMTIELPSRAKTSGSLNMTFAETASFPISTILNNLFQYARSDNYFENTDYIEAAMRKNAKSEDQFNMQKQILKSYRTALPKGGHLFNILVKMYRMKDTRMLEDIEEDQYPTFVYYYKGCDLKSVRPIEFDYNSDKPIDVSCEWIYQYFEELTFEEYAQRYGSIAEDDNSLQEEAIEQKMNESFKDNLPSNQKTMNDIVGGFNNSNIVKKMRSRKATSQMKGYTPNNVSSNAPTYSTAGNYDRSYRG